MKGLQWWVFLSSLSLYYPYGAPAFLALKNLGYINGVRTTILRDIIHHHFRTSLHKIKNFLTVIFHQIKRINLIHFIYTILMNSFPAPHPIFRGVQPSRKAFPTTLYAQGAFSR